MTAANQQIVTAFEELNLTPEQISEAFGFNILAVKSVLSQFSSKFKSAVKSSKNSGFTDDEAEEMYSIILNLARYSDDENLQYKAACRIIDDKKGRLDIVNNQPGLQINVVTFNEQMQKALNAERRTLEIKDVEEVAA